MFFGRLRILLDTVESCGIERWVAVDSVLIDRRYRDFLVAGISSIATVSIFRAEFVVKDVKISTNLAN